MNQRPSTTDAHRALATTQARSAGQRLVLGLALAAAAITAFATLLGVWAIDHAVHQPMPVPLAAASAHAISQTVRHMLFGAGAAVLALVLVLLLVANRILERHFTGPAHQLMLAAEAVADGDLSRGISGDIEQRDDEIGRLARAVGSMITELRRLATELAQSATETANMTSDITAGSEQMAAAAGEIAHTASGLSHQSAVMADTIRALASSSEQLVGAAHELDRGAREGVERNARLRALALDNRARLDESSTALTTLSGDVEAGAAAVDELTRASEAVRDFVTLVKKLARQSKLLALNAAMEAARAGEHGHGFAVVAEEVRRLAAMSSDAAERTEEVVGGVLRGVAQSRASSERTVETVRSVRGVTEEGSRSFGQIETAVTDTEQWTAAIQRAVVGAQSIARDMRGKLDSLAAGTETFAAAMQEVAASSEEQSASTEQIAAAASTLSAAAGRLTTLVANLRVDNDDHGSPPSQSPGAAMPNRPSAARPSLTPATRAPSTA